MNHKYIVPLCVTILCIIFIILCMMLASAPADGAWTEKQEEVHKIADAARSLGLSEDNELIQMCKKVWNEEQENMNILAKVMKNEAPGVPGAQWCPVWHQLTVGQIIINRTRLAGFPDTIRDVVSQRLPSGYYAYNPAYCYGFDGIEEHYYELAKLILDGKVTDVPGDLIYHDNAPHGPIWKTSYVDTGWYASTTYFCTGG